MEIGQIFIRLGVKPENLEAVSKFKVDMTQTAIATKAAGDQTAQAGQSISTLKGRFSDLISPINAARLQILAFHSAVLAATKSASNQAAELLRFQANTGLSAQRLQEWQSKAAAAGVDSGELVGAIKSIQSAQVDMMRGQVAPAWRLLGIDPRQDPFAVLEQVRSKLAQMPAAMGTKLAQDLGMSWDLVASLRELHTLPPAPKELLLTDREISRLKGFNVAFNSTWNNIKLGAQKFGAVMQPIAEGVLFVMNRLLMMMQDITNGFQRIMIFLEPWKNWIVGLATLLMLSFAPFTTMLVGLLLVLEDFATYMRGGKSVTGAFINWVDKLGERFTWVKSIVDTLRESIAGLLDIFFSATEKSPDLLREETARAKTLPEKLKAGSAEVLGGMIRSPGDFIKDAFLPKPLRVWLEMFSASNLFNANAKIGEMIARPFTGGQGAGNIFNFTNTFNLSGTATQEDAERIVKEQQRQINNTYFQMPIGEGRAK